MGETHGSLCLVEHVAPSKKPGIITSINNLNINDNIVAAWKKKNKKRSIMSSIVGHEQLKCKHAKMQTTKNKMQFIENPKRI